MQEITPQPAPPNLTLSSSNFTEIPTGDRKDECRKCYQPQIKAELVNTSICKINSTDSTFSDGKEQGFVGVKSSPILFHLSATV